MADDTNRSSPDCAEPPVDARAETPPRREFLKASAAAAGASLLGGCLTDIYTPAEPGAAAIPELEHLVVVMFENRSLDNMLGYLYEPGQVPRNQTFNGLAGPTVHRNPVPGYVDDGHPFVDARVSPGTDRDMSNPNPDPGEPYQHVNTQLFTTVDPPENQFRLSAEMVAPFNAPPKGAPVTMTGFVQDYCNNFVANKKRVPTFDEYRVIMDSFGSESLPVISTLARGFAVYDAWHCAVPSQTFCNRSFFNASSSSGFVVNEPYTKWLTQNFAPTIFNRLQDAGIAWKVYFDPTQLISLTGLIHAPMLFPYWKTHFASMDQFYRDVAGGTLPAYAFVEPRMLFNHNDYHPPVPTFVVDKIPIGEWSDVRAGDLLLHQIYSAVRASPVPGGAGAAATGSNALNTLLLVTFDEHGGTFDHVAPGPAVTPDNPQFPGDKGFLFDRLGVRVPAIAISAHTQANTVINRPMHHAAVIRTLCRKYDLPHLTERDRNAPTIEDAFNLPDARLPHTWPVTTPRPVPPGALITDPRNPELARRPLNDLEHHIVGIALARFSGVEPTQDAIPKTVGEAYQALAPITRGAFGGS